MLMSTYTCVTAVLVTPTQLFVLPSRQLTPMGGGAVFAAVMILILCWSCLPRML